MRPRKRDRASECRVDGLRPSRAGRYRADHGTLSAMFRLSLLALVAASLACQEEQPDPTPATTSTGAQVTTGSGASTNTGMTSDDTGIGATCRDFKPGECGECIGRAGPSTPRDPGPGELGLDTRDPEPGELGLDTRDLGERDTRDLCSASSLMHTGISIGALDEPRLHTARSFADTPISAAATCRSNPCADSSLHRATHFLCQALLGRRSAFIMGLASSADLVCTEGDLRSSCPKTPGDRSDRGSRTRK